MAVIYGLLVSAVLLLGMAAAVWAGLIDMGEMQMPLVALLALGAGMDLVLILVFLRRITR
jgi:hypothetical protein